MFALFAVNFGANAKSIEDILVLKEEKTDLYSPEKYSYKKLVLKMDFNSPVIKNSDSIKTASKGIIRAIDIVYSDYPAGFSFSKLIKERLKSLEKICPEIFLDHNIKWRLIRQSSAKTEETARKLFHGIVISYRPAPTKATVKSEIRFLDSIFIKTRTWIPAEWSSVKAKKISKKKGLFHLFSKPDTAIVTRKKITRKGYYKESKTLYTHPDSVVKTVLNRNQWKDMLIVADVTGSMSPYTAQLLAWLQLNSLDGKLKQFVCFNDGDMKMDDRKKIGLTGGIYEIRASKYLEVLDVISEAMSNGSGGDGQENDIEGILSGQELCQECDNIILIADNWAPMRDSSLAYKVKKPVKIIVCGGESGINPQYLDLARTTGGSVHTIENDITDLSKLNEGQQVNIGSFTYRIQGGKFVSVSKI